MPLLDNAISQPCSCHSNNRLTIRSQAGLHSKHLIGNERVLQLASAFSWKTACDAKRWGKHYTLERNKVWWNRLTIKAVSTLETMSVPKNNGVKGCQSVLRMDMDSVGSDPSDSQMESSSEHSTELDEREKLRRMKISEANKGKIPWNKGRTELDEREKLRRMKISEANKGKRPWNKGGKHSPETLHRMKERTWVAFLPKETRIKIGMGMRLVWERRRKKLMVQETCHHEWQNLIALAAKRGLSGEKELQWDSYQIMKMKMLNLRHARSKEVRIKIGVGMRLVWEKRRKKLMVQQTCLHEWQNLIALAAKRGLSGQKELKEWLKSIEQRKKLMVQENCHREWQNLIALAAKRGLLEEKELQWDSYQILKMTMPNLRHVRSKETRIKTGMAMRLVWERRRKKLMVQQTCLHEWQNLIALAAKRGLSGQKELMERLKSIEQRKKLMVQETCHHEWQNLIALAAKRGLSGEKELQWDSYQTLKMAMFNPRHARSKETRIKIGVGMRLVWERRRKNLMV